MLANPNDLTLVVHFDPVAAGDGNGHRALSSALARSVTEQLQEAASYCRWAGEHARSVALLLPDHLETQYEPIFADLDRVSVVRHPFAAQGKSFAAQDKSAEVGLALPERSGREPVWLVNGNRLPIVDWGAARWAARRSSFDVLLFDPPAPFSTARYPESVEVDETGRVLSFRRHYSDSPTSADRWSGEACLLAVAGRHARAVVGHVAARGWGLESIGSLTRHLHVRWSSKPCLTNPSFNGRKDRVYLFLKRLMDISIAGAGLIVLSPFLLAVAILVKGTSRGPILFSHRRQGLNGKEFRCLKFRSMACGAEAMKEQLRALNEVDGPQFKIRADPRLTKLGSWLRRYNIDEIPQLLNVLFGQMSLVGPRPSPDDENQLCPAWRRARLSVKPGMTGLWQVLRRRNDPDTDFQEWIYYDVEYVKDRSLWLDWQLLVHTPWAIFAPRRLSGFIAKLEQLGMCGHAGRIGEQPAVHMPQ